MCSLLNYNKIINRNKLEWKHISSQGIVILLALFVRLYNIHHQSIWFDEYVVVGNAKICSLRDYFLLLYTNSPDYGVSPGSSILFYFLIHWFPEHDVIWRLLPISFGVATIFVFYGFVRKLFGDKIAFFSGLLFAMSPFNIWFHQEIKCYSFLQFFSILSFIALYEYYFNNHTKARESVWLLLNGFMNALLPWFHLIYLTLPIVQLTMILVMERMNKTKKIILWSFVNIITIMPWIGWFWYVNPFFYNLIDVESSGLSIYNMFLGLFGNDCVRICEDLIPEWKMNIFHYSRITKSLLFCLPYLDYLLLFITSFSLLLLVVRWFLVKGDSLKNNKEIIYFFLIFLIPSILFAFLGSLLKESIFHTTYFFYFLPAIYLIEVYSLMMWTKHFLNWFAKGVMLFLLIAYSVQGFSLIYFVNRTNYKDSITFLEKNAGVGDLVLGQRFITFWDIFKFYKKRNDLKFNSFFSVEGLISEVEESLSNDKTSRVWVLIEPYTIYALYNRDVISLVTENLRGVYSVHWKLFPGHYNMYIGMVERNSRKTEVRINYDRYTEPFKNLSHKNMRSNCGVMQIIKSFSSKFECNDENLTNYNDLLNYLGLNTSDNVENQRRIKTLRKYISHWPLLSWINLFTIEKLIEVGELDIAEAICLSIIKKSPDYCSVHILLGIIYKMKNEHEKSEFYFKKGVDKSVFFRAFYKPLWLSIMNANSEEHILMSKLVKKVYLHGLWTLGDAFNILYTKKFHMAR